jgi:pyruvate/2-oxoglutarate dehydrogenase complex dihydrolipoamide acyltransferase (E2) component
MPRVRVKTQHGAGGKHRAGDVIEVSDLELRDFGDKFEIVNEELTVNATDAAVELAQEHDIDLAEIEGSGTDGRVLKSDVEAVIG